MQEVAFGGPASPIEAYSCTLHVMDLMEDGPEVTCMMAEDWQQAQLADRILGQVIVKMQDGTLDQCPYKPTNLLEVQQLLWEHNHLKLRWGILYRKVVPKGSQEVLFQLLLPAMNRETTLEGCHDEISHLGLERMLNLMCVSSGREWLYR